MESDSLASARLPLSESFWGDLFLKKKFYRKAKWLRPEVRPIYFNEALLVIQKKIYDREK